jgi:eukaryotic-like serine/threonine-protein kinase
MNAMALGVPSDMRRSYRQLCEIGRGGMARVYLAESLASGIRKLVVLKVLNPELCTDPDVRAAFRREAELSAQMNHPNVVQVMAVVESEDTPVIVMEYLDGVPLSLLLREAGRDLPLRLRMYVLAQVLAGLHHFHELRDLDGTLLGAVHRDVSPQNIMVLHEGPVKVLDFGIAKITANNNQVTTTGLIRGKIHYMPPEQLLGGVSVDRRADIFAVGVMLWEAAADRRMWDGKTEAELLRCLATGTLPNLRDFAHNVPESVCEIVQRATELERERRFATALEMQVALERALAAERWLVQPRELAEFMALHFGERRRSQELKVRDALRAPRDLESLPSRTSELRLRSKTAQPSDPPEGTWPCSEWAVSRGLRARWHYGALFAMFGLALAGAWGLRQRTQAGGRATPRAAPSTVTLEVEALPRGAEILLDGRLVGRDHFAGPEPLTGRAVVLEVRAARSLTERRELTLSKDISLQFALQPEPTVAKPGAATKLGAVEPGADTKLPSVNSAAARAPSRNVSSAARKPVSPSANSSRNCSPPYVFGADGVKTYKPECF